MPVDHNNAERKRKPRNQHAPYKPRKPRTGNKNGPKSSAQLPKKHQRSNLTLHDWMTVFAYIDKHPGISQDKIVKHFATCTEGVLIFDQSTLSRKLKERKTLEDRVNDHPNALSTKRVRLVTRSDVELALFLWVKHMEEKGESVNGPMLLAKRGAFEDKLNVPQEERLTGDGWLPKFKKAYNIKEFRRHGEAASVDIAAVEAEKIRMRSILANYAPKNRFNFDETGFFAFAPPDRGLSTEQMSGKKRDKFRITMGIGCNADGTEKLPPVFIGKYANPRCFKNKKHGFYYRNNKTAWMTMVIFEEWLKALDVEMRHQNRKICLLVDNFSAHYVSYQPQNVRVEFFEPNLTSHVQPCDAGIIRTVKALYRKAFCLRAIDLDDAGEREIYKINLLEAILMVKEAWAQVSPSTIANCWNHTKIQPESNMEPTTNATQPTQVLAPTTTPSPMKNLKAWELVRAFATSDGNITLPQAEDGLRNLLGKDYRDADWQPILKIVMDAERDAEKALEGLEKLAASFQTSPTSDSNRLTSTIVPSVPSKPEQLADTESELSRAIRNLKDRNRIIGSPLTLEEMLNLIEETEIGDAVHKFEGGDDEIIAHVNHEMAVRRGEVIELDDDDDEDAHEVSFGEMIQLCAQMEKISLSYAEPELKLGLSQVLRKFRIQLRKMEDEKATQATLDRWF